MKAQSMRSALAVAATAALTLSAGAAWASMGDKDKPMGGGGGQTMTQMSTISEIAASDSRFSTLNRALQATGLDQTLAQAGPYTVLAPTNAAFEALPAGTLDNLLKPENKAQLSNLLRHHVLQGTVMAADIRDGQTAQTLLGQQIAFNFIDPSQTAQMGGGGGQAAGPKA
ncbi:MAG: fasciclin domain-containing protein, partial [Candidatus Sericytochromatia bacterium]